MNRLRFQPILSVLIIAVLLSSLLVPVVEASVVYGPAQFEGDWYKKAVANKNGKGNGFGNYPDILNGSPVNGCNPSPVNYGSINPGLAFTTTLYADDRQNGGFPKSGGSIWTDDTEALADYRQLMDNYCPEVKGGQKQDKGLQYGKQGTQSQSESDLIFKYLDKYVQRQNFTIDVPHGNYTLYLRNGDGTGKQVTNGTIFFVRLNDKDVFTPCDISSKNKVLSEKATVGRNNTLQVFAIGAPASYLTLWLEDEAPDIVITSPWDDTVSNGSIRLKGYVTDKSITTVTLRLSNNTTIGSVPVTNGNFTTDFLMTGPVKINLSGVDSTRTFRSVTLCLDGDLITEKMERQYGFDPLNSDSDSKLTQVNEASNGISDGSEMFGGQLPAFVKARTGADPLKNDTDADGLTDYFEVTKLGWLTSLRSTDSDGDGMSDAQEDPDLDSLSNLQEQTYDTNPYNNDTDGDSLSDNYEVNVSRTNPLAADTDGDGLTDDSDLKLGTDPNNPDTDGDGILDGDETYTTASANGTLGVTVAVKGKGDLAKDLFISNETSVPLNSIPALVSPVVDLDLNRSFESADLTISYDPARVTDSGNLSIFYYNESAGTFQPLPSTIDSVNHTISATTGHFSTYVIFHIPTWDALFKAKMTTGRGTSDLMFVDMVFTIDSSGSMSWNDPAGYRKIAAKNFVGALIPGDRAGVVDFDSYASVTRPLTGDFNAVNMSIDSLNADGGTDIGAGVSAANNQLITSGNRSHAWMMILLTDGQGSYNDYYTQQAKANNITIYTVGLSNSVDSALLTRIATGTGGQYFQVTSADQLPQVFRNISEEIEPADTDGDGLTDTLETTGFRDGRGKWYRTDPNNRDTDSDGLEDRVEAGLLSTNTRGEQYYNAYSDPTLHDTDGDSLSDFDEYYEDTDALIPDCDHDGLNDGLEFELGTDSWSRDTDGDGYDDCSEHYDWLYDPLVPEQHFNYLEIAAEVVLGALLGDWGTYGGGHGNVWYLAGQLLSGFIAIGDIRDICASIINLDGVNIIINAIALIPGYGDAAKVISSIGQFLLKNPKQVFGVAIFAVKNLPYKDTKTLLSIVDTSYGKGIVKRLSNGMSDEDILKCSDKSIDLNDVLRVKESNTKYTGWGVGNQGNIQANIERHYNDHVEFDPTWNIRSIDEYTEKACNLLSRRDSYVNVYYQRGNGNIAIYDRVNKEFAVGDKNGNILTYYRPQNGDFEKADNYISDREKAFQLVLVQGEKYYARS